MERPNVVSMEEGGPLEAEVEVEATELRKAREKLGKWRRRREAGTAVRRRGNTKGHQAQQVRLAIVREEHLMVQEALREKEEAARDPYVHEGFFYLDKETHSVCFSFFRFHVLPAQWPPEAGKASRGPVYPVVMLTSRDELKRKAAVSKRTWDEWKRFEELLKAHFNYRYRETLDQARLGYVAEGKKGFEEKRRKAISDYLLIMTKDSRLLHTNLFQAFMYTGLPLRSIYKTMVNTSSSLTLDMGAFHGMSIGKGDQQEKPEKQEKVSDGLRQLQEEENDEGDDEPWMGDRAALEGFLDSQVEIPAEAQKYELDVLPSDMTLSEITKYGYFQQERRTRRTRNRTMYVTNGGGDILCEAGHCKKFDEFAPDVLELSPDADMERRREKGGMMWWPGKDDMGMTRNAAMNIPSCREKLVVDCEAARQGSLGAREIQLRLRSREEEHEYQVHRSFYDMGSECQWRRMKEGRGQGDVFTEVVRERAGNCPDGNNCPVRKAELDAKRKEEERQEKERRRRLFRRRASDCRITYTLEKEGGDGNNSQVQQQQQQQDGDPMEFVNRQRINHERARAYVRRLFLILNGVRPSPVRGFDDPSRGSFLWRFVHSIRTVAEERGWTMRDVFTIRAKVYTRIPPSVQEQQQEEEEAQNVQQGQPSRSRRRRSRRPRRGPFNGRSRPMSVASSAPTGPSLLLPPSRGGGRSNTSGNTSGNNSNVSRGGGGGLKAIFGGERSYADRRNTLECVEGDSKVMPDRVDTWQDDQHYPYYRVETEPDLPPLPPTPPSHSRLNRDEAYHSFRHAAEIHTEAVQEEEEEEEEDDKKKEKAPVSVEA